MNFVEYIENRYQELTLENQSKEKESRFDIRIDSEIKAAHEILTAYRWLMKWALMPKIFIGFLMVKLGYSEPPQPVILNKMKAERAKAQEAAKQKVENNVTPIQTELKDPIA